MAPNPARALRILITTGSRADFGLWKSILLEARRRPREVSPRLLATAMHLDERFGVTISDVRAAGVPIAAEIPSIPMGDSRSDMAAAVGTGIIGMAPVVEAESPDWLLLLGDRGEQLAAAVAGLHLGVAIAHLHGGERTLGAVDDAIRDMISRIAHLHFVATQDASDRLRRLGEQPWRIRKVGAPGLDLLRDEAGGDADALRRRFGLGDAGYLMLVYHPETVGEQHGVRDLEAILRAIERSGFRALAIGPNSDAGGRAILDRLQSHGVPNIRFVRSLTRNDYATLLNGAAALIGNSSSGLIEAPLLGIPAINVGDRQLGRTRGDNVIDVPPEQEAITAAISTATTPSFRAKLSGASPYGSGEAARQIIDELVGQRLDRRLLMKSVGDG